MLTIFVMQKVRQLQGVGVVVEGAGVGNGPEVLSNFQKIIIINPKLFLVYNCLQHVFEYIKAQCVFIYLAT